MASLLCAAPCGSVRLCAADIAAQAAACWDALRAFGPLQDTVRSARYVGVSLAPRGFAGPATW